MRGLIIFVTITDPNGDDTRPSSFEGSGARPGPFRRTTPLSPHVSLAIAGSGSTFGDIVHVLLLDEKVTHFFYKGEMFVSFNTERRPI